ncbi:MAG: amidohydrolase family protein, partial [Cyanobacteria bacterium P01_G01_bin.38]
DRYPDQTPQYRGVTLLHEIVQKGIPLAVASDNCRDPFFAYGDHDGLEVFTQSVRIGHLDRPYDQWPQAVTIAPAQIMGLDISGKISIGQPADLICFKARTLNELISRNQSDRVVIRQGQQIDATLPDYSDLDDLMLLTPDT